MPAGDRHATLPQLPRDVLAIVAKRPAPGATKTRLSPPLTGEQAAALYECFLQDTVELMRRIRDVHRVIAYLPTTERPYFEALAPDFELILQQGESLGPRLNSILHHYLERGAERVVIMDSDSPTLPARYVEMAFARLTADTDVVFGPCDDGGYYLIGARRPVDRLLLEVQMSTSSVLQDTLVLATCEKLRVELLPAWYDIDDHAALERLHRELRETPPEVARHTRAFLSVTWPELSSGEARR